MKPYKIIILGSQCSGKSTLIKHLQETTDLVCIDHDQEIKRRNGGSYPDDQNYVNETLLPEIEQFVLEQESIIYTACFWGLSEDGIDNERIEKAKKAEFKFVYLLVDKETLVERNNNRNQNDKYDASEAFDWYAQVYKDMDDHNQFDLKIAANQPIEDVAHEVITFINEK